MKELLHLSIGIILGYAHSKLIDLMIDYYQQKTVEDEVDDIIEETGDVIEEEVVKEVETVVKGWIF